MPPPVPVDDHPSLRVVVGGAPPESVVVVLPISSVIHTHTHTHTHNYTHTITHTHKHTHNHTHSDTQSHTSTHTHSVTHIIIITHVNTVMYHG